VAGNHKFTRGSVLTEPERHRLWREQHAERTAARRKAAQERQENSVMNLLDRRAARPWPSNAVTVQDVQGVCGCKEAKAAAVLRRMTQSGKLTSKHGPVKARKRQGVLYYTPKPSSRSRRRGGATTARGTDSGPAPPPATPIP
jgi:hypothetical protein